MDSNQSRSARPRFSIPLFPFLIAGWLFLFSLCAPSVSFAEPGHSYIGYQLGYESTQGDVTGSSLFAGIRAGYGFPSPLSVTLRGGLGASWTGAWGMGARKDKI